MLQKQNLSGLDHEDFFFFFFFACDRCPAFVSKGTVLFVVTESAQEDDRMLPLSLPWRKGV